MTRSRAEMTGRRRTAERGDGIRAIAKTYI